MSTLEIVLYPLIALAFAAYIAISITQMVDKNRATKGKKEIEENWIDPNAAYKWAEEHIKDKDKENKYTAKCIYAYMKQQQKAIKNDD